MSAEEKPLGAAPEAIFQHARSKKDRGAQTACCTQPPAPATAKGQSSRRGPRSRHPSRTRISICARRPRLPSQAREQALKECKRVIGSTIQSLNPFGSPTERAAHEVFLIPEPMEQRAGARIDWGNTTEAIWFENRRGEDAAGARLYCSRPATAAKVRSCAALWRRSRHRSKRRP